MPSARRRRGRGRRRPGWRSIHGARACAVVTQVTVGVVAATVVEVVAASRSRRSRRRWRSRSSWSRRRGQANRQRRGYRRRRWRRRRGGRSRSSSPEAAVAGTGPPRARRPRRSCPDAAGRNLSGRNRITRGRSPAEDRPQLLDALVEVGDDNRPRTWSAVSRRGAVETTAEPSPTAARSSRRSQRSMPASSAQTARAGGAWVPSRTPIGHVRGVRPNGRGSPGSRPASTIRSYPPSQNGSISAVWARTPRGPDDASGSVRNRSASGDGARSDTCVRSAANAARDVARLDPGSEIGAAGWSWPQSCMRAAAPLARSPTGVVRGARGCTVRRAVGEHPLPLGERRLLQRPVGEEQREHDAEEDEARCDEPRVARAWTKASSIGAAVDGRVARKAGPGSTRPAPAAATRLRPRTGRRRPAGSRSAGRT